jgi:hypothetical protein
MPGVPDVGLPKMIRMVSRSSKRTLRAAAR